MVKFYGKMTIDTRLLQDDDIKGLFDSLKQDSQNSYNTNSMRIEREEAISSAFIRYQVRGRTNELITINNAKKMSKMLLYSQLPDDEKIVLEKYSEFCETRWKTLLAKLTEYKNAINFELVEYLPEFCIEHIDFSISAFDNKTPVLLTFIPTRMDYSVKNLIRFEFEKGYKVDINNDINNS